MSKQIKQVQVDDFNSPYYFLEPLEVNQPNDLLKVLPPVAWSAIQSLFSQKISEIHLADISFINRECWKMIYYYSNNPDKKPKNLRHWSSALIKWLENSWSKKILSHES